MTSLSFLPPALTSLLTFFFIFYLFTDEKRKKANYFWPLIIFCINSFWWHFSWIFLFLTHDSDTALFISKVGHIGILGLPFTYHHFFESVAKRDQKLLSVNISIYLFFSVSLWTTDWVISGVQHLDWGYYPVAGVLHPVFLACIVASALYAFFQTQRLIHHTKDRDQVTGLKICQTGAVIYSLCSIDFAINYKITEIYPFGFIFSLFFIIFVGYSITYFDLSATESELQSAKTNLEESARLNRALEEAITERDHLRDNLELEVSRKTKQLEDALQKIKNTQGILIQNEKLAALGTMAAGLAHELNNSMNYAFVAIDPLEEVIENISDPEEKNIAKQLTASIRKGIKFSVDIIKNLKTFSSMEKSARANVKIKDHIDSVLAILKNKLTEKIHLQIQVSSDLFVSTNPAGINQILMNLISNAIDALDGHGNIGIQAQKSTDSWELLIQDDGKGMDDITLSRIFDPFYTTKEVGKGTGLGMFVVNNEVARLGGRLSIESKIGQGTRIQIIFNSEGIPS